MEEVRGVKVSIGDIVYFPIDKLGKRKPDIGRIYYIDKFYKLSPAIIHFGERKNIEFKLIEIVKSEKKWWQFWKRRKIVGCNYLAIK